MTEVGEGLTSYIIRALYDVRIGNSENARSKLLAAVTSSIDYFSRIDLLMTKIV